MDRVPGHGQPVMGELRLARRFDEPRPTQIGEVPGHRRLRQAKDVYEVADAQLAGSEQVQDSYARWICEPSEDRVEILDAWYGLHHCHDVAPFPRFISAGPTIIRLSEYDCNRDRRLTRSRTLVRRSP